MYKCCASKDGICRNAMVYGAKCDGYREKCVLRQRYENIEKLATRAVHNLRKTFGAED